MPQIIFVSPEGVEHTVNGPVGATVMTIASREGIPGIIAECGGGAMCATCHVYVEDAWIEKLPTADDGELEMLDCTTADRLPGSRLSCQLKMTDELDGLRVLIPHRQR